MLRISEESSTRRAATLRLEGRVIGPWVAEVRRCCEEVLASGRRLTLDLSEVSFVERDAIGLFKELTSRGVMLINCSPFLAVQLNEIGSQ